MKNVKVSNKRVIAALSTPCVKKKKIPSEWLWAYLFICPMVLGVLIFSVIPILYSFFMAFTDWNGMSEATFVGFNNFTYLLNDTKMKHELVNTAIYTLATVPLTLLLSLSVANLLNQGLKGTGVFRIIYFLPNVTMPVAVALVWRWLFNSKVGLVNLLLKTLALPQPMWLADPNYILWAMIIVSIWSGIGYNAVILLAGLQGIPPSLYEAADIDGAKSGTKFWKITFPLLTPSLFFLLTMSIMGAIKVFDIIYTFTGASDTAGGPLLDASRTLVFGIYEKAFSFLKMGLASAESIILFAIIAVITLLQFVLQKKWVFYD